MSRAVLASPLGFLIGLSLGALGGGGSILAVPALVYGAGQGARAATTTSLVVVGATALAGMVGHLAAGRVRVGSGLVFGLAGIGGSAAGAVLAKAVPPEVLLLAFSGLMVVAAQRMWRRRAETPCRQAELRRLAAGGAEADPQDPADPVRPAPADPAPAAAPGGRPVVGEGPGGGPPAGGAPARREPSGLARGIRVLVAGTVIGFLTGFFGVGGGFVVVPGLVLALGYAMPVAVGTSLLVIAVNCAESLVFRLSAGGLDWGVAAPFTIAGVLGVVAGDFVAGRVPAGRLVGWFVALLVAVAAYTAARSAAAL